MMFVSRSRAGLQRSWRWISWLAIAGVGAWIWMVAVMAQIFVDDHEAQQQQLSALHTTRRAHADATLRHELDRERLGASQRVAEGIDARTAYAGVLLFDRGRQLLPRTFDTAHRRDHVLEGLLQHATIPTSDATVVPTDNDEHSTLLRAVADVHRGADLRLAIAMLDRAATAGDLDPATSLAAWIGLAEAAANRSPTPRAWLQQLLFEGVGQRRSTNELSLQERVLLARDDLGSADFALAHARVVALCERVGVPYEDFDARAQTASAPGLAVPPSDGTDRTRLFAGHWIAEEAPGRFVGVAIDLPARLAELTDRLRASGLLDHDDTLAPSNATDTGDLAIDLHSPTLDAQRLAASHAHDVRVAILLIASLLVAFVLGSLFAWHRGRMTLATVQTEFLAGVGHELRTPLASIRLLAETLEQRLDGEPRARDYPGRIVADIDQLTRIVDNLLSYARLERGDAVIDAEPVELAEVVASARRHADQWCVPDRDVELTVGSLDGRVFADARLLELLLTNLWRNACQASTRRPATLHVTSRPHALPRGFGRTRPGVRIEIRDNGPGFGLTIANDADALPLAQAVAQSKPPGPAASSAPRGLSHGLGVRLCDAIAELHGGSLWLLRSDVQGSTIAIDLPVAPDARRSTR